MQTPAIAELADHVFHLYVVRHRSRDPLREALATGGVDTLVHYPVPVHLQRAYADLGPSLGALPVTEKLVGEIVSLPLYPGLDREKQDRVLAAVQQFAGLPSVTCP